MSFDVYDVPPARCLLCHEDIEAATAVTGDNAPTPGDVFVCWYCQGVMIIDDDLTLRLPDDAERDELLEDRRFTSFAGALRLHREGL